MEIKLNAAEQSRVFIAFTRPKSDRPRALTKEELAELLHQIQIDHQRLEYAFSVVSASNSDFNLVLCSDGLMIHGDADTVQRLKERG